MLPLVVIPAVMPSVLLPLMVRYHVHDFVRGMFIGTCLGLAILGLVLMIMHPGDSAPPRRRR